MFLAIGFLCLFVNFVGYSSSMYSNKAMEGYPTGYLSDCPVSSKVPTITKKTLKQLRFFLQGEGTVMTARKIRYNYYQMKELGQNPDFDFNKETVLYVGGYLDHPSFPLANAIAPIYKKMGYNVLLLDTNYFTTMSYPLAALYMRPVGKHTAEMLYNLTQQGLDPKKLQLIGLSLGGQTISFIAKNYRLLSGMNISRLTALDMAGPCFRNLGPDDRLDLTDADFVETINTNIDGFGMAAPVGHVNFYVNGGEFQPGDIIWTPCNVLCSHLRAYTLWISAIQHPDSFIAIQCASVQEARARKCYDKTPQVTNLVGPKVDKNKQGIFFLATQSDYPYYLGKKGLKKDNEFFWSMMKRVVDSSDMKMR